ncbi:MAG TPA: hypothetical protein DCR00_01105 [Gammaproteobacteria bacterium]|nr:hypothetical protein [Gammaproteobacteria bacterium]
MECFDIYSCFPSAVAIACEELGLACDDPRGLTVTGGLPFFGGPGNNYSLHGIASMVEKLRRKPSAFGLITANGGYLTKHASGVYSCQPLASEWQLPDSDSIQREVDSLDYPVFTETPQGDATIETYTVCFKRGEPVRSIVIGRLLTTDERFVANTAAEPQLFDDLIKHDWIGRRGQVRQCGELNLFEPV